MKSQLTTSRRNNTKSRRCCFIYLLAALCCPWEKSNWGYLVHGVWNHCPQFCGTVPKTWHCIHSAIFTPTPRSLRTRAQSALTVTLHNDAIACAESLNDRWGNCKRISATVCKNVHAKSESRDDDQSSVDLTPAHGLHN